MDFQPRWKHRFEVKPNRWVYVPEDAEIIFGEELIVTILEKWSVPNYFYHLNLGGHVAAVKSHLNMRYFCCLDIENFFGSVSRSRVTRVLKPILGYDRARAAANRSTVKAQSFGRAVHRLPYGFPQSTLLASMALDSSHLGVCLKKLAEKKDCAVSVYVDDLILSSESKESLTIFFDTVNEAGRRSGFNFAPGKIQPPCESIASFNILLSNKFMCISEERMEAFKIQYREAKNKYVRQGIIGYINSVNPAQVNLLY